MMNCHTPPGRTSISCMVVVKPLGPHHCTICTGSTQASKTRARGAAMTAVVTISRSAVSVIDRLIGRRPEIGRDRRRRGGFPGALGHQDPHHLLLGVRPPGRAEAAVPAVLAGHGRDAVAAGGPGHAATPPPTLAEAPPP